MALLHTAHEHERTKKTFNSFLQARRPLDLMEPKKKTTLRITVRQVVFLSQSKDKPSNYSFLPSIMNGNCQTCILRTVFDQFI